MTTSACIALKLRRDTKQKMSLRTLIRCLLVVGMLLSHAVLGWAEVEEVILTEEDESPPKPAGGSGAATVSEADAGVMVRPFEGAKSQKLHETVVSTLESAGVILIPAGFEDGAALGEDPKPYVHVARKVGIKAYIHGSTTMSKKGWTLQLRVRNGKDGQIVAEPKLRAGWLPGLLKKIDKDLMRVLEEPLSKTSLPEGGPPADDEAVTLEAEGSLSDDDPNRDTAPRSRPKGSLPPASPLDANLAVGAIWRSLRYNKAVGDVYEHGLQPHRIGAPAVQVGVHWYPGAHVLDGMLAHIGLGFSYYRSIGGSTVVNAPGGASDLETTFSELNIGFRGRIPLHSGVELGLNGGWGTQSMVMEGDNETTPTQPDGDPGVVPDVEYTYYRFGPDVRFELGIPLSAGVFVRTISLSTDDGYFAEERWFPNAAGIGLDAVLTGEIELTDSLALTIGGEARYYGIDANSGAYEDNAQPNGNPYATPGVSENTDGLLHAVAGGASDIYLGGFLGARYELAGVDP